MSGELPRRQRTKAEVPERKIWSTALGGLVLMVAVTLGWILTFDSGLLTAMAKPDHLAQSGSRTP